MPNKNCCLISKDWVTHQLKVIRLITLPKKRPNILAILGASGDKPFCRVME